jgi:hypothetical protein
LSLKKVVIISPFFPPSNAADMQRVRTSLPYFKEFGWDATVVAVEPQFSEMVKDDLLLKSLPPGLKIYYVKAFSKKITAKFGLGSLALRSMWHYRQKVNELLLKEKFDLIYFSTTQFPLCILGPYWKKKFGIPYVIDMQDPWHSDYYQDKPKAQRPPKYWFSYRLNKYLEPIAMGGADGLISVSDHYINDLRARYPQLLSVPAATITFGAFEPDMEIAHNNRDNFIPLLKPGYKNIVYIGRGGMDMQRAIKPVFEALKKGMNSDPWLFGTLRFYFIGTSYAPEGKGTATILPLAQQYDVAGSVIEITGRISYYHTLLTLGQADALFIPGSDDPQYTASKIYPYLLTKKPLLAVFNEKSSAIEVLNESTTGAVILSFGNSDAELTATIYQTLSNWANGILTPINLTENFGKYSSRNLTQKQAAIFDLAIKHHEAANTNA